MRQPALKISNTPNNKLSLAPRGTNYSNVDPSISPGMIQKQTRRREALADYQLNLAATN
jgi:hypothetical protein